jgi:hypothetical protein
VDNLVISLRDLAVLASGFVSGGMLFALLVVVRGAHRVSPVESLHMHQVMLSTDLPDAYIQPAGALALALGGVLLGLEHRTAANVVLTIVPMVAFACIIVLTRTVNRPINRELGTWTDADVDRYPPLRRRWDRGHAARTICGTTAFISYIVLAAH